MSQKKSSPLSGLASTLKVTLTCYPNGLYQWIFLPEGLKKVLNRALYMIYFPTDSFNMDKTILKLLVKF